MKTYSDLVAWLETLDWPAMTRVSADTGTSISVISKLRDGRVRNPRIGTVEPLMAYARRHRRMMVEA